MNLKPYQQRVLDEKTQLDDKIQKLESYIQGTEIEKIALPHQRMLRRQLNVMKQYSIILNSRIQFFLEENEGKIASIARNE